MRSAKTRATASFSPPGGYGTMKVIGLLGQSDWARAPKGNSTAARMAATNVERFIVLPP